jgi:protein-tyrosine phosphatase
VGFVDLHSHVLAGLDDGSRDLATTRAMIDGLGALGFSDIFATPHQKSGHFMPSRSAIDEAFALARQVASGPTIRLGAENMWDDVFFERSQREEIPGYDGGTVFLVELRPSALPLGLVDHLFRLRLAGRTPVLAHPERYEPLWGDDAMIERLRHHCAFQIDLGAIAGYHGKPQQKAARRLIENGFASAVASDAHSLEDVRYAAEGIAWIEKRFGRARVVQLLDDGPRAILAGEFSA